MNFKVLPAVPFAFLPTGLMLWQVLAVPPAIAESLPTPRPPLTNGVFSGLFKNTKTQAQLPQRPLPPYTNGNPPDISFDDLHQPTKVTHKGVVNSTLRPTPEAGLRHNYSVNGPLTSVNDPGSQYLGSWTATRTPSVPGEIELTRVTIRRDERANLLVRLNAISEGRQYLFATAEGMVHPETSEQKLDFRIGPHRYEVNFDSSRYPAGSDCMELWVSHLRPGDHLWTSAWTGALKRIPESQFSNQADVNLGRIQFPNR